MKDRYIDMNCDLGESFGIYRIGEDDAVLPHVTSANIACGFHAGDPHTMKLAVRHCLEHGVRIGAHPGLPDLQGFGRRMMDISAEQAYELILYQVGALQAFIASEGGIMQHVKPHGALYHLASHRREIADAIAEAVNRVNAGLLLFGPPGSELIAAAERYGLQAACEAFADRRYAPDGSLVPRSQSGSVINAEDCAEQAVSLALNGTVIADDGTEITQQTDTICIHGDGAYPARIAASVRAKLEACGIAVRAFR